MKKNQSNFLVIMFFSLVFLQDYAHSESIVVKGCGVDFDVKVNALKTIPSANSSIQYSHDAAFYDTEIKKIKIIPDWNYSIRNNNHVGPQNISVLDEDKMSCVRLKYNEVGSQVSSVLYNYQAGLTDTDNAAVCHSLVSETVRQERQLLLKSSLLSLKQAYSNYSFNEDEVILSPFGTLLLAFDHQNSIFAVFNYKTISKIIEKNAQHIEIQAFAFDPANKWLHIEARSSANSFYMDELPLDSDAQAYSQNKNLYFPFDSLKSIRGRYLVSIDAVKKSSTDPTHMYVKIYDLAGTSDTTSYSRKLCGIAEIKDLVGLNEIDTAGGSRTFFKSTRVDTDFVESLLFSKNSANQMLSVTTSVVK